VPREGHFSAAGNRLVAECTAEWLVSKELLDRSQQPLLPPGAARSGEIH
jgi:hypothetical protein